MNFVTEPLRRHAVTIGLSLLLVLVVVYYALGYLPAREAYLRARYFRVMSRIGENLQDKEKAYGKRVDAMRREIWHAAHQQGPNAFRPIAVALPDTAYRNAARRLQPTWQRQDLNTPAFDNLISAPSKRSSKPWPVGELTEIRWQPAQQRVQFEYAFNQQQHIVSSASIVDFVRDLLRPDTFGQFLIIGPELSAQGEPQYNQVYYSSFAAPATIQLPADSKSKAPRWLQDSTGILVSRQVELAINGQSYQLFVQPLRLRGAATWLLAGAVPTADFRNEQRALPDNVLEVALAVILLGLLALPYMKIVFMNARERLGHADVVLCGLSLVFATTFLMLLSLSPIAKYDLEPDLLDAQLRQLSGAVEQTLIRELREVRASLQKAEAGLRTTDSRQLLAAQEKSHAALRQQYRNQASVSVEKYVPANKLDTAAVGLSRAIRTWQPTDRIQWLDKQGEGLIFVDYLPTRFNPSLQDREYMRQALKGNLWLFPPDPFRLRLRSPWLSDFRQLSWQTGPDSAALADTLFRLASVMRYGRQGEKAAVFVRPSHQPFYQQSWAQVLAPPDSSLQSVLSIYTTQLRSLSAPILPPGYSFCLMDERGEVQFHSDARLNLSENMFQDTEPVDLLRTALLTHEATQGVVQYQGHYQSVCVRQLGTWPLYLITMADLRAVQARQMQTLSLAATLLGAIGLAHLLFIGLYVLVLPRRHRILDLRYSLRRLWPSSEREDAYWRIMAALVGGAGLLVWFADFTMPTVQPFLLLLLPLYAFGFGFRQLQLPSDKQTKALARVQTLVLAELLAYNGLALYWTGPGWQELTMEAVLPWGCILLFQLLLVVMLRGIERYLSKAKQEQLIYLFQRPPRLALRRRLSQVRQLFMNQSSGAVLGLTAMPVRTAPAAPVVGQARPLATFASLPRSYHWFKRAYALMLLGWILVVSILPPIYCYHLAYRVERELQLHYAHLRLGQQLQAAQRRAATERLNRREQAQSYAYLPFFFSTHYAPLATPRHEASRSTQNFRKLVRWLHPSFDTLAQAPRSTLPLGSHTPLLTTEHSEQQEGEHNRLQTYIPRPNGTYDQFTAHVSDLAWGRHWYLPQPIVRGESPAHYLLRWLRQVGLLLLLSVVLYVLLRILTRRIFNLDLQSLKNRVQLTGTQAQPSHSNSAVRQYFVKPLDSTFTERNLFDFSVLHLNCQLLPPQSPNDPASDQAQQWLTDAQKPGLRTIALEHFDYRLHDPEFTRAKIEILEKLTASLPARLRLVVVSKVHPALFADCGHTREQCPSKSQHQLVWALGDRLLDTLANFTFAYEPLHPEPHLRPDQPWQPPAAAPSLAQELTQQKHDFGQEVQQVLLKQNTTACLAEQLHRYCLLRWFVKVECDALPILKFMEPELERFLLDGARRGRMPAEEDVILIIQRRTQLQLRQLWETLSPHERYLLYDLAQDGLVNGRDSLIINDLLERGLLLYDQLGIRIVNETFRSFILIGLPQEQALRIEREALQEAQSDSAWSQRSFPVFLLLSAAGLFIFVTQRSTLNEVQSFLTAILSIAPLAYRFLSFSSLGTSQAAASPKSAEG
ncbi:hypothetical protein [Hymenobacter sp.]|jgi:hypothetical protein|uniref:hypothetical protein n=1 Tax=Hymenobacter sp. TaxID=1898978 RepID=UPI002EDB8B75